MKDVAIASHLKGKICLTKIVQDVVVAPIALCRAGPLSMPRQ